MRLFEDGSRRFGLFRRKLADFRIDDDGIVERAVFGGVCLGIVHVGIDIFIGESIERRRRRRCDCRERVLGIAIDCRRRRGGGK